MRRMTAVVGTAGVAGLLLMGCGSSGPGEQGYGVPLVTMPPTTQATVLTPEQLEDMLLTEAEMGTGWTAETYSSDGSGGSDSGSDLSCLEDAAAGSDLDGTEAHANYMQGDTVFAYEGLGAMPSEAKAREGYEAIAHAFDACTDVSFIADGETILGTITSTGSVDVGTRGKGYTMSFSVQGVPVVLDVIVTYVDNVDVVTFYGGIGDPDPDAVQSMTTAVVEKVSADDQQA